MFFSTSRSLAAATAVAATLVCTAAQAHPNHPPVPVQEITTEYTWSENIRPILRKHCMSCHSPAGVVMPYFDMSTYDGTETTSGADDWGYGIAEEVLTGRMPPWDADPRYNVFKNRPQLSFEDVETLVDWAHGGRPEGPDRDLATPPEFLRPDWTAGPPDAVFTASDPYTVPKGTVLAEVRQSFPLRFEDDGLRWISKVDFMPDNRRDVYAMIVTVRDPKSETAPVY